MSRFARGLLAMSLAAAGTVRPAFGQVTAFLEGAGARIAYDSSSGLSAVSISPSLQWLGPSTTGSATGSFAQFTGGGWTLQGAATGSIYTAPAGGFRGELGGAATGTTFDLGGSAGELLARGRLHWIGHEAGLWVGGAIGQAWNGVAWHTDRQLDAGAWVRRSGLTLTGTVTPTWIGPDLRLVDAGLAASFQRGAVELTGFAGLRRWSEPAGVDGSVWGGGSAAVWLDRRFALVAAGGSFPSDYAQGFTSGSYLSLGLRLGMRAPAREPTVPIGARSPREAGSEPEAGRLTPVVRSFAVSASGAGAGRWTLRVGAPGARRVEIMGDFTEWRPIPLSRGPDGTWTTTLDAVPGAYRMNLRVDGDEWGVPPGIPALRDEFGGPVGMLRIGNP